MARWSPQKMSDERPKASPDSGPIKEETKPLLEILEAKAPDILKDIPEKKRVRLAKIEVSRTVIKIGPLPDAAELAEYNKIIPNGADRILKMAERQSAHRIQIESLVIGSQQKQATRGQYFGLIIGLTGLSLGAYVGICGFPWLGASLGGATLVSLVVAFLKGKSDQSKNLAEKRPEVERRAEQQPPADQSRNID